MKKITSSILALLISTGVMSYCEVESNGDIYCSDRGYVGEVESNGDIWSNTDGYSPNSYKMGW